MTEKVHADDNTLYEIPEKKWLDDLDLEGYLQQLYLLTKHLLVNLILAVVSISR